MTIEFNKLLPVPHGDKAQVWIVATRDQVLHLMNEFYVKRSASDPCGICEAARVSFTLIIPASFTHCYVVTNASYV
jgi:hypothetical protein